MPTFEITTPDGKTLEVNAPEGATKEQALAYAQSNYKPTKLDAMVNERPATERFTAGAKAGVDDMYLGLKQYLTKLSPDEIERIKSNRELSKDTMAKIGSISANLAVTALPGLGLEGLLAKGASAVLPKIIAPTAAAAGTGAAINAATTPTIGNESKLDAAMGGAIGGAVGNVAARGLARVAEPITKSADVDKLLGEGIVPTMGQAAGPKTMLGRIEQRLQSIPIIGDIITKGRSRAVEELNQAALNRVAPGRITQVGVAGIRQADEFFDEAYRTALTGKKVVVGDTVQKAAERVKSNPDIFLTEDAERNLDRLVAMVQKRAGGEISGEVAKKIDSQLGAAARNYSQSSTASDRDLGVAIREVQKDFRAVLDQAAPELKEINGKYANFLRVQRASGYLGNKDGVFSPNQLRSAVKALDSSRNKGAFAKEDALMQDLANPASRVLGDSVPNSGTAERLAMLAMLGGAGTAAGNEYIGGPGFVTAAALAPLLYSRMGSRYMIGNLPGQGVTADALRNLAPLASQIGRASNKGE